MVLGCGKVLTLDQTGCNHRQEIERVGYAVGRWFGNTPSGKAHAAHREEFGKMFGGTGLKLVVGRLDRRGRYARRAGSIKIVGRPPGGGSSASALHAGLYLAGRQGDDMFLRYWQ